VPPSTCLSCSLAHPLSLSHAGPQQSPALVKRRNCPPYFLLSRTACRNSEEAFREIVTAFGFRMEADKIYTRCVECNGTFVDVDVADIDLSTYLPFRVRSGFDRNVSMRK
jgi:hypothetical protein